jgi:FdhD protein
MTDETTTTLTPGVVEVDVARVGATEGATGPAPGRDLLAVEEPLEIRLHAEVNGEKVRRPISVTMRTPGDDPDLVAGFVFTEGIVRDPADIVEIARCGHDPSGNTLRVKLRAGTPVDLGALARNFYTTSSCGVCGKASIDAIHATARWPLPAGTPVVDAALVRSLPARLRDAQALFERTGGLHASALFDTAGRLHAVREDVGRHNALDKVIGGELLAGRLPAHDRILLVSGRASFELVQKALMAGIPILAAVGAPSSLAVQLAASAGMTLLGFVREDRFNVYAGGERVRGTDA